MSVRIEGRIEELLTGKNFCTVATLREDGSIHCAPVWVDVQDGRPVLNTAEGRAWPRNLERDPRVTLTVQNHENPYEYVSIRGRATASRLSVLAQRRQRQPRRRDHSRPAPGHGHHPRCHAALRIVTVRPPRRALGRVAAPFSAAPAARFWCGAPTPAR